MSKMKVDEFEPFFQDLSGSRRKSIRGALAYRIDQNFSREQIIDFLNKELNDNPAPGFVSSAQSHEPVFAEIDLSENESVLAFKAIVLTGLIIAATIYLVGAALEIYEQQLLPTVLLEIFPLAVIFFARHKLINIVLSMAYGVAGLAALVAIHSSDVSKARSTALDTNPEYHRLSLDVAAIQKEIDGMPANYRARRNDKRLEMRPLSDRMTEIERAASGGEDSKTGELKSHVRLVARILLFLGSLVFTHALSETLSKMHFGWLRRLM